jgi:hypothetical protein
MVDIMTVDTDVDGCCHLRILNTIHSNSKPITLHGDLLALSDDVARTTIWNWRANISAILEHSTDDLGSWVIIISLYSSCQLS